LELLTILYAMLAALTGISVGEASPQRSAMVGCSEAAMVGEVAAIAAPQASVAAHRPLAAIPTLADQRPVPLFAVAGIEPLRLGIAWIDLARRHL
jgi:hypothetical protein